MRPLAIVLLLGLPLLRAAFPQSLIPPDRLPTAAKALEAHEGQKALRCAVHSPADFAKVAGAITQRLAR